MLVLDVHHSCHFILQHYFSHVPVVGVNLLACEELVVILFLNTPDGAEVTLAKNILEDVVILWVVKRQVRLVVGSKVAPGMCRNTCDVVIKSNLLRRSVIVMLA